MMVDCPMEMGRWWLKSKVERLKREGKLSGKSMDELILCAIRDGQC